MRIFLALILFLTAGFLYAQRPVLVSKQEGHTEENIDLVRFSPNEQLAFSKAGEQVVLWDLNSGKFIRFIEIPGAQSVLDFAPDGQSVIAVLEGARLVSWDLFGDQPAWQLQLPAAPLNTQVSPDDRSLALLFPDQVWYVDLGAGRLRWRKAWSGDPDAAAMLYFSEDGSIVNIRNSEGEPMGAFDAISGRERKSNRLEGMLPGDSLLMVKNGKIAQLTADGRQLQLIDFQKSVVRTLPRLADTMQVLKSSDFMASEERRITDFAFSRDGRKAVIAYGKTTRLYGTTFGVALTRDGFGALLVWDVENDQPIHQMEVEEIILSVALSTDGTRCLSTSSDRTVHLWDVEEGREIFRMEREASMETKIEFTPDLRFAAMTRYDGAMKTWELTERNDLFFSEYRGTETFALGQDGKQLLTAGRNYSMNLWDTETHESLGRLNDRHRCLAVGTALDISPDGKLALLGSSEEWRVMEPMAPLTFSSDTILGFIRGPLQDTIGINLNGDTLYGKVELYLSVPISITLNQDGETETSPLDPIYYVQFTADYQNVSLWDLEKKESVRVFPVFNTRQWPISAVRFSPDGRLGIARILDETMERGNDRFLNSYVEYKLMAWDLKTGRALENPFGENSFHAIQFEGPEARAATIGPDVRSAGGRPIETVVTEWRLSDSQIMQEYRHDTLVTAVAFHPDGQKLCTLTDDGVLREWDTRTGERIRQIQGIPVSENLAYAADPDFVVVGEGITTIWNLNTGQTSLRLGNTHRTWSDLFFEIHSAGQVGRLKFLPDAERVISATYDGAVQCWDYKNGIEIFTLNFPGEKDWVVTTPSGLFDASAGALENMYFRVGTEIIELEQLKERYYEPGLLQKLLGFSKDPVRFVEGFDSIALYPVVQLQLDTTANKLTFHLSPRSGGLGKVSIFINGKEIIEDANPPKGFDKLRDTVGFIELDQYARYFLLDTLNVVSVRAYNQAGWLKSAPKNIEYQPAFARSKSQDDTRSGNLVPLKQLNRRPALYAVVVGTSQYAGEQLNLKYASKDARDIAAALGQVSKQLFFDSVFIQLLVTDTSDANLHPTKDHIRAAFEKVRQQAKAEDVLVAYFSGHGINYGDADQSLFYYLTMDISSDNLTFADIRNKHTVSSAELTRWIKDIPALKQVLILDACNSGQVVENMTTKKSLSSSQIRALDRMKDRTGMFVLTGSAADKISYEAGKYGQGLLTYSLLQGMSGLALTPDKRVDVSTLFEYARDVVPELAEGIGGVQKPMKLEPLHGSFDIGIVNDRVKIPLAQVKPVFIRNNFQDEDSFGDGLGLTRALADYFQQVTARGAQAELIYVDVNEYENAYSIKGLYTIKKDEVKVRGRLFKGKTALGEFQVTGKKDALPALVEAIVDKVSGIL